MRLGALCAIDHEPREWTGRDHGVLEDLAGAAMAEVELRRANRAVAEAAAELHFAATHDSLTRLGNRRALLEDLGQLLSERRAATFALLDLHGMRAVNDAHGLAAGDELLVTLARRLESALVGDGHVYRLGGVQLCALLAETGPGGVAGRVRGVRGAQLRQARGRLSRGDGRAPARSEEHRLGAAPRGRPAGTLRACCDRSRLTSRNAARAARLGGGEEKIARQHAAGKLTARERIALLIDDGTFNELGIHARPHFSQRAMDGREAPADGVLTGWGEVDGRNVAVVAYDFTVMAGAMGMTGEIKVARIRELALTKRIPIVWLLDSAGARIQEAVGSLFAGTGHLFREEVVMSGVVPQVAALMGPCAAGTAYIPGLADFVPMVSGRGSMALAGPAPGARGDRRGRHAGGARRRARALPQVGRGRSRVRVRRGVHRAHQAVPLVLSVQLRGRAAGAAR